MSSRCPRGGGPLSPSRSRGDRAAFAVPWHGVLLVGVTDTPHEADPASLAPDEDDVGTLLAALGDVLPAELMARDRVLSAFAGLRVLARDGAETHTASREHLLDVAGTGLVSVAGGKLTTHRRIALAALRRLPSGVRPRRLGLCGDALPGASAAGVPPVDVDAETVAHLVSLYGGESDRLLATAGGLADGLERIHPSAPDVWAQAYEAVDNEWAVTLEDVARRRTTLAVRGLAGDGTMERLAARLSARAVAR